MSTDSGSLHGFTSRSYRTLELSCLKYLNISEHDDHCDLLAFLSQVQGLGVDLLSLTWYPNQRVGRGGFASINQFLVHGSFSFAVKRLLDDDGPPSAGERIASLMTELAILTHPEIAKHPHVIALEGVCWVVDHRDDTIAPCLVFEKASFGDLAHFVDTGRGRSLSLEDILALSGQLARGMQPENVLIFENESGLVAKIADFGSSSVIEPSKKRYEFPVSGIWTAPEHHHRGVNAEAACGLDLYRLCLVFLWLLLGFSSNINNAGRTASISSMRRSGSLQRAAVNYVSSLELNPSLSSRLQAMFSSTLAEAPADRHFTLFDLVRLFEEQEESRLGIDTSRAQQDKAGFNMFYVEPVAQNQYHCNFLISHDLFALLYANFLVRQTIFRCFQQKAERSMCKRCRQGAAFQLAFCYYIGFGATRDLELAQKWAEKSNKTLEDLEDETDEVVDMHVFKNRRTDMLQLGGFDISMDHLTEYRRPQYQMAHVVATYTREIVDFQTSLPEQPLAVAGLKATLAALLGSSGKWEQACQEYRGLVDLFRKSADHGPEHNVVFQLSDRLADTLRLQGRLKDAKMVVNEALKTQKSIVEADPPALLCYSMLGMIEYDEHNTKVACQIFEDVLTVSEKAFGPDHPRVLYTMSNLACAWRVLGQLSEAEQMDLRALSMKRQALDDGDDPHYSTLTSAANLALTYSSQGRWDDAEELETWVLEKRLATLGPLDPASLTAKKNLASTYFHRGRVAEAEQLFHEVVEGQRQVLGEAHPQTQDSQRMWEDTQG